MTISIACSVHVYAMCVFIGGVSPENPAPPPEGVKRPATDDDSSPSPKKP